MLSHFDEERVIAIAEAEVTSALRELSVDLRLRADDIADRAVADALRLVASTIDWRSK